MLQTLELGLKPVMAYKIEEKFFEEFGWSSEVNETLKPKPKSVRFR